MATTLIRFRASAKHGWQAVMAGRHVSGGRRGQNKCGQATKGTWGMSWRQEALKGVEDCEKLGGAVKRALIPGFPN